MTWIDIALALILLACIIYIIVVAIDLSRALKRANQILDSIEKLIYETYHKLDSRIHNLDTLNIAYNGTLIKMEELIGKEDDLK